MDSIQKMIERLMHRQPRAARGARPADAPSDSIVLAAPPVAAPILSERDVRGERYEPVERLEPVVRVEQPARVNRASSRPRPARSHLYDKIGQTMAYAFSAAISLALWYAGAFFTLAAISALGVQTSLWWWLVPIGITTVEIWLMPRPGLSWQSLACFLAILLLDVCSSWYGVIDTMAGRHIPLGTGFVIPQTGWVVHVVAVVAGLLFAFIPEKLARWSVTELVTLWR